MPPNKVLEKLLQQDGDTDVKRLQATVDAVFNTDNMALKSNLTPHQVTQLIRGKIFAVHHNSKLMHLVVDTVLQMSVSTKGGGRKDLRTVLMAVMRQRTEMTGDAKLQDKLL